jgi:hypothetical protein
MRQTEPKCPGLQCFHTIAGFFGGGDRCRTSNCEADNTYDDTLVTEVRYERMAYSMSCHRVPG